MKRKSHKKGIKSPLLTLLIIAIAFCYYGFSQAPSQSDENTPLYFGNPSMATTSSSDNYLMEKNQFCLSYSSKDLSPNWVMWHLDSSDLGNTERGNDFRNDVSLPNNFYSVRKNDYQFTKYGFDRGHVCPSADRTSSVENNSVTFLMTNMLPQSPDLNRIVWKELEDYERRLSNNNKELYIVAGGYGKGGSTAKGYFEEIPIVQNGITTDKSITVPSHCWKIIMVLDKGDNDMSRVTEDTSIISVFIPNQVGVHKMGTWKDFLTTVDYIEEKTGYDFFDKIPDEIEDVIESRVYEVR